MDPIVDMGSLVATTRGVVGSLQPMFPDRNQLRLGSDCLMPGDVMQQRRVRANLWERRRGAKDTWLWMWTWLWEWEAQKLFWAILKEFSSTLRVVSFKGGVDRKWMGQSRRPKAC
jgi:hypothetical protein